MKRTMMWCLLVSLLVACGRSAEPQGGSGTGANAGPAPTLQTILLTPERPAATATAFVPVITGDRVEIDTIQAGLQSRVVVTMTPNQSLYLRLTCPPFPVQS
jgi:hypothetical protein